MSNALNRTIEKGEVVVIRADILIPAMAEESTRLFKCQDGFGMLAVTAGAKIAGKWVSDGQQDVIRGEWIDATATEAYQARLKEAA